MFLNVPLSTANRNGPQAVLRGVVRVSAYISRFDLKRAVLLEKDAIRSVPDADLGVLDQNFATAFLE